jgi:hypothetical protein
MSLSIAAYILEVYRILHPTSASVIDGVTRLVGPLAHAKLPAAMPEHLGHERQTV